MRPILILYIEQGCLSCGDSIEVAERARDAFPHVDVHVIDLGVSSDMRPDRVFAVPTFMLDGEVVSLGTPSWERLEPLLRSALNDGASS